MRTDAILKRLLALHPNKLIDLKLDRIERLLGELGRPQDRLPPVIHVAGTNGKGSVIAFCRAMIEAGGLRAHVYTSPHLVAFRERIRLAGKLVSGRRLNEALLRCEAVNAGRPITFFEITTAAAIVLFSEVKADYVLLEVGLGGRFDATNVIAHPLGTIITPVSIDHVDFLGPELSGIAREKAGILKSGSPAIVARQEEAAEAVIMAEANRLGVNPYLCGREFDGFAQNGRLVYQDEDGLLDLPIPGLAGPHQYENAAVAIAAMRHFNVPVSDDAIAAGMKTVTWPARLMPLKTGKLRGLLPGAHELWVDGGHNEAGGRVLAAALKQMQMRQPRPLVLIFGTFANKDSAGFLSHFSGMPDMIYTVGISGDRASPKPGELALVAHHAGLPARPKRSVAAALREAAQIPNARIVICGALHLAGNVLKQNGTYPE